MAFLPGPVKTCLFGGYLNLKSILVGLLVLSTSAFADNAVFNSFPISPDPELTPGSLCTRPNSFRYPEQIPYCERNVSSSEKYEIIDIYDHQLGYRVGSMNRQQFKIDHYLPLCMGGSNEYDNLWPQHRSVYEITDPMEPLLCEKMKEGRLSQEEAVELIKRGKADLSEVDAVIEYAERL